jgi:addiction module HigA family antidote
MIKPPHPGEIIKEDYLLPLGMSVSRLAGALGIGTARLNEIVLGKRGITADTALRLARCLGTSAEFWLNLQSLNDLRMAARKAGGKIERTVSRSRSHEAGPLKRDRPTSLPTRSDRAPGWWHSPSRCPLRSPSPRPR